MQPSLGVANRHLNFKPVDFDCLTSVCEKDLPPTKNASLSGPRRLRTLWFLIVNWSTAHIIATTHFLKYSRRRHYEAKRLRSPLYSSAIRAHSPSTTSKVELPLVCGAFHATLEILLRPITLHIAPQNPCTQLFLLNTVLRVEKIPEKQWGTL